MASRKFVVVDRDIVCESRFSNEELRKKFFAETTERVVIRQYTEGGQSLAITEDGLILIEDDGYVNEASPHPWLWDLLERKLKQAENDLRACRKIRQAFKTTREFGPKTKSSGPFSGLLKRRDR